MLESVSPYALLQASKPKSAPTVASAYDRYRAMQACPPPELQPVAAPRASHEPPSQEARSPADMPLVPRSRTHYIEQIRSRHNAAARRAYPPSSP